MGLALGAALVSGLFVLLAAALKLAERLVLGGRPRKVAVNDGARLVSCPPGASLLEALLEAGIYLPASCAGRGACGLCKVRVLPGSDSGSGLATAAELPMLSPEERAAGYRLACLLRPMGDVRIELPEEVLAARLGEAEVVGARRLTRDMRELVLLPPAPIDVAPGQYVQVLCPSMDGPVFRAYSVLPEDGGRLRLLVKRVPGGAGSGYLHLLRPGGRVHLAGPYGSFRLSDDPSVELVLVAGGCVIAPALSILRYSCARWPGRRAWLFVGVRSRGDVVFEDELADLGRSSPGLSACHVLSHPRRRDAWDGEIGLVHEAVARRLPPGPGAGRQAYLCGPKPMLEATLRVLESKGIPRRDVYCDTL